MNPIILRAGGVLLAATLAPLASVAVSPAAIAAAAQPAPAVDADAAGLAARGYDVTAYFTAGRAIRGTGAHQLRHDGAMFRFASAAALERFKANPAAYAPTFGGYCAWAVSQGYIAPGDPQQWAIVDGRLYLNFNARAKASWDADRPAAIKRGTGNWPAVLTRNQNS